MSAVPDAGKMKRACCACQVKIVLYQLDFSNDAGKRKLIRKIRGEIQCLTGKGKMSWVRIFKGSRNWYSAVVYFYGLAKRTVCLDSLADQAR